MVIVKEEMVDVGLHFIEKLWKWHCSIVFDLIRKSNRIELSHKFLGSILFDY